MRTGEGKTLVATLPTYLNALTGKGVHVVTVNDYPAKRDSEWTGHILEWLGLKVGCIDKTDPNTPERRAMYACDVTYGTNNEFGFDYLRDNMAVHKDQLTQREHYYAIIGCLTSRRHASRGGEGIAVRRRCEFSEAIQSVDWRGARRSS